MVGEILMKVERYLTVGDLLEELKDLPKDMEVRYSKRKSKGLYSSSPLHDILIDEDNVLLTTYYTLNGNIKQIESLDKFF